MSRYTVLLGLLVAMVAVYDGAAEVDCGDNAKWNICGSACEPSCQNPTPKWCPRGIVCHNYTTGGCRCDNGYFRDTMDGSCVLLADCQNNEGQ